MKKHVLIIAAFVLLATGCTRKYGITDRAVRQLPVSLKDHITEFVPEFSDLSVRNLKTVYENDSICLLQFTAAYKDTAGVDKKIDLRYTYLYDDVMSMMNGKMTFNEAFNQIPCMPDELIKMNQKTVGKDKESVYQNLYGSTLPVNTPFDE